MKIKKITAIILAVGICSLISFGIIKTREKNSTLPQVAKVENKVLKTPDLSKVIVETPKPRPITELPVYPNPITESDVTINWYDSKQNVDGFGISEAFGKAEALQKLSEPNRSKVLDLLFDKNQGIGLSMLRNKVNCTIEPTEGNWDWNSDNGQVWMMQEAKKRGCETFLSTVWTPPGWMKTNNSTIGGSVKTDKYQAFSEYLSRYVTEYKKRFDLDIYAISMANEPAIKVDYESCEWTAPQIKDFIKNNIIPTFAKDQVPAKFIAGEDNAFSDALLKDTLNDEEASSRVDIVGAHGYDGGIGPLALANKSKKPIWMTEVLGDYDFSEGIDDGLIWAKRMGQHFTEGNVSAWLYWWGAYTTATSNSGLVYINNDSNQYTVKKRLWTIGNYSKFIKKGDVRVSGTKNPTKDVYITAFKDATSGKLTIIAVNCNVNEETVNLNLNGLDAKTAQVYRTSENEDLVTLSNVDISNRLFKGVLPKQSVTTFVINGIPGAFVPPVAE